MAARDGHLGQGEGVDVDERALARSPDRRTGGGHDHGVGHGILRRGHSPEPLFNESDVSFTTLAAGGKPWGRSLGFTRRG